FPLCVLCHAGEFWLQQYQPIILHGFQVGTGKVVGSRLVLSQIQSVSAFVPRTNQASNHSSEAEMRSQTAGPFICPRNASHQGFWGQYWLLQLADLVPQVTRFWKMV
ncbi:mCG58586, isoform CRA_b, partial [Mus musculus]